VGAGEEGRHGIREFSVTGNQQDAGEFRDLDELRIRVYEAKKKRPNSRGTSKRMKLERANWKKWKKQELGAQRKNAQTLCRKEDLPSLQRVEKRAKTD
jgi:hypothetical protein